MHKGLSKLDKSLKFNHNFMKVFSDPYKILKILRENLSTLESKLLLKNKDVKDEVYQDGSRYGATPQEQEIMDLKQEIVAKDLGSNFLNTLQEEMVNLRNALILSDIKLLQEQQQPPHKRDLGQLGVISDHLIDEILRDSIDLRDGKVRVVEIGLNSEDNQELMNFGSQIYEILIENAKLRKGLNQMYIALKETY